MFISRNLWASAAMLAGLATAGIAQAATTATFDELPTGTILTTYQGLQWSNFGLFNGKNEPPQSGYLTGKVSKDNVAFNLFGAPANVSISSGTFSFLDAYLTGAWNDGLQLQLTGKNGATTLFSTTLTLNTVGPMHFVANWAGLTELDFVSFGGTENPALIPYGNGVQIAMDNFTFNTGPGVPEPSIWAMMLLGFAMGGVAIRRRAAKAVAA